MQIDDLSRGLSGGERRRGGCCRSNNYVRSRTKSTPGVRYLRRGMYMRYLNRRPENQQQGAAKSKGQPPRVPCVLFALLIVHHFNYNVLFSGGWTVAWVR